jgi:DNA-binding CsgD family transcriptional regulator
MTNAEIGLRLKVSEQTIKFHLKNVFSKMGVRRRTELVSRLLTDETVHEMKARA